MKNLHLKNLHIRRIAADHYRLSFSLFQIANMAEHQHELISQYKQQLHTLELQSSHHQ